MDRRLVAVTLPIVFLPGMMCDARLFEPQTAALSAHSPVLHAPIGHAETIQQLAADLLVQAPPRFALAGLSMGGIVAMDVVRQAPGRVAKLCLLDTNHLAETPERQAAREPQIEAVRRGELRAIMRDEMKPNYLFDGPRKAAILDLCMAMAEAHGAGAFVRQSRALQTRPDQTATLRAYAGKALVLCGRHDALCPVSRHEEMAGLLANARLIVVEDAGHMPTLEQPDFVNAALAAWLAD